MIITALVTTTVPINLVLLSVFAIMAMSTMEQIVVSYAKHNHS